VRFGLLVPEIGWERQKLMTETPPWEHDAIGFLRRAAAQLRLLAEHDPQVGIELRHLAGQLEAEADDLEGRAPGKD